MSKYEIKVESYSNLRLNGPSTIIQVQTGESAPTGPPLVFEVAEADMDRIEVEWRPPSEADCKGAITGYVLDYELMGASNHSTKV